MILGAKVEAMYCDTGSVIDDYELIDDAGFFISTQNEQAFFPKLDGELFPIVMENADVIAPCAWMDGAEVSLTIALNNYYRPMTEENADDVIADVYDFLSRQIILIEPPEVLEVQTLEVSLPEVFAPELTQKNERRESQPAKKSLQQTFPAPAQTQLPGRDVEVTKDSAESTIKERPDEVKAAQQIEKKNNLKDSSSAEATVPSENFFNGNSNDEPENEVQQDFRSPGSTHNVLPSEFIDAASDDRQVEAVVHQGAETLRGYDEYISLPLEHVMEVPDDTAKVSIIEEVPEITMQQFIDEPEMGDNFEKEDDEYAEFTCGLLSDNEEQNEQLGESFLEDEESDRLDKLPNEMEQIEWPSVSEIIDHGDDSASGLNELVTDTDVDVVDEHEEGLVEAVVEPSNELPRVDVADYTLLSTEEPQLKLYARGFILTSEQLVVDENKEEDDEYVSHRRASGLRAVVVSSKRAALRVIAIGRSALRLQVSAPSSARL
ncbi:MAG: hypothetical protein QG649_75 [Patescibacteria group bacterium]|nr:hypothetical protein [Patescibacteria group bacterium]